MPENKTLAGIVIGFALFIVVGVTLVGYGIFKNAPELGIKVYGEGETVAEKLAEDVSISLEDGARLVDWQATDTRLILRVQTANGDHRMILVDLATGAELGRITVSPAAPAK